MSSLGAEVGGWSEVPSGSQTQPSANAFSGSSFEIGGLNFHFQSFFILHFYFAFLNHSICF